MPIVTSENPDHAAFYDNLSQAGVRTIDRTAAIHQVMRPARIGLLNLMPAQAMPATEIQWLRYISRTWLQVEVVPIKFDQDSREQDGGARAQRLARYTPFSKAAKRGFDALIVTGDNRELDDTAPSRQHLAFDKIRYMPQLRDVMQWADESVALGIYSCLGAHVALDEFHGIERGPLGERKIFGVFEHDTLDANSPFTKDMNSTIRAPHSRHGNVPTSNLRADGKIDVLANNADIGWLLAHAASPKPGGQRLYLQGHPEYDESDLNIEYLRDVQQDAAVNLPANYYNTDGTINLSWRTDTRALHANIFDVIYSSYANAA